MPATCLRTAVLNLSGEPTSSGDSGDFDAKAIRNRRMNAPTQWKGLLILVVAASLSALSGCKIGPNVSLGGLFSCSSNCAPAPEYLYATSTNHILAFTISQSSGALSASQVMAGPNQSGGIVASTVGQLYLSDFSSNAVDGFDINSASGGLTAITGSPFSLGGTPPGAGGLSWMVESSYLYATDLNAGTVAGFLYNPTSGALTPVPGSPFPAGNTPVQAVQAATQASTLLFLYVSDLNDSAGGISAFAINQQNGALSPIPGSPFPTGAPGSFPGPSAMALYSNFLYVALAGTSTANNKIAAFAIDPATGELTPLPGSPFVTGSDPLQMVLVPVTAGPEGFLYTANVQDGTISAFTADSATGVLTPVSGSPYTAGTSVGGLAVSLTFTSAGNYFLYAADPQAENVLGYYIDGSTGGLSPIAGSPFAAGGYAPMLLTVAGQ